MIKSPANNVIITALSPYNLRDNKSQLKYPAHFLLIGHSECLLQILIWPTFALSTEGQVPVIASSYRSNGLSASSSEIPKTSSTDVPWYILLLQRTQSRQLALTDLRRGSPRTSGFSPMALSLRRAGAGPRRDPGDDQDPHHTTRAMKQMQKRGPPSSIEPSE